MYRPVIYRNGLLDDFFDFSFPETRNAKNEKHFDIMKTDIKETENGYEAFIDIPGYGKNEIEITLENGNLTVSASKNSETEEKDEKSGYIRKERFSGSMQRTFYVGEYLTENDIHASFENGVLRLDIPKITAKPEETRKVISID